MQKSKKILSALLAALFILSFSNITVQADTAREIIIDSVTATKAGYCEIIGHYTNVALNTQITCVVGSDKLFDDGYTIIEENFTMDNVAYIDQVGTGNNGTFLIQFTVDRKWSEQVLTVKGGTSYGDNYTTSITLPELPPGVEVIDNNSVMYGRDVYHVPGVYYEPDSIAASIAFGGNIVCFKIGDNWYDLMDEDAVDNSYLVSSNAMSVSAVENKKPRYYYGLTQVLELKYE